MRNINQALQPEAMIQIVRTERNAGYKIILPDVVSHDKGGLEIRWTTETGKKMHRKLVDGDWLTADETIMRCYFIGRRRLAEIQRAEALAASQG